MPPKDVDDWKTVAFRWLSQQGVPTVLLFAILASGWYAVPWIANTVIPAHIASINASYAAMEKSHREEREGTIKIFADELEKYRVERGKDRDLMREFLFHSGKKPVNLPGELPVGP